MQPWMISYSLDVSGCNPVTVGSKASIQEYVIQLCKTLELERIDDCLINDYLINGDRVLTFFQYMQSGYLVGSSIPEREIFCINIFSADQLCTSTMTHFTKTFFEAESEGNCQVQKRAESIYGENDSTD